MDHATALAGLCAALGGGPAAGVEAMNNMVVGDMKANSELPPPRDAHHRLVLEAAGVQFGNKTRDSGRNSRPMFVAAVLPKGWTIARTDHYLYQNLKDEKGRTRATMMIHMQDQDSWLDACCRLHGDTACDNCIEPEQAIVPAIMDSNRKVLWRGKPVKRHDEAREVAEKILAAAYPEYTNPAAYWDIDDFPKLPKSEADAPAGKRYDLHTELYRQGSCADSGHVGYATYPDDKTAIKRVKAVCTGHSSYETRYTLTCEGKTVERWTVELPRPKRRKGHYFTNDWGNGIHGE